MGQQEFLGAPGCLPGNSGLRPIGKLKDDHRSAGRGQAPAKPTQGSIFCALDIELYDIDVINALFI